jgi:hypothetical protein
MPMLKKLGLTSDERERCAVALADVESTFTAALQLFHSTQAEKHLRRVLRRTKRLRRLLECNEPPGRVLAWQEVRPVLEVVHDITYDKLYAHASDARRHWEMSAKCAIVFLGDLKLIEIGPWAFGKEAANN